MTERWTGYERHGSEERPCLTTNLTTYELQELESVAIATTPRFDVCKDYVKFTVPPHFYIANYSFALSLLSIRRQDTSLPFTESLKSRP